MALTLTQAGTSHVSLAGLTDLLNQLAALMEAEDYDDDFFSPTESAAARMRGFLEGVSGLLTTALPSGTLYADGDGGLRLEWIRPNRELRLVISAFPQGRSYIYHEQGDEYAADYSPTVSELGKWLNWLESPNPTVLSGRNYDYLMPHLEADAAPNDALQAAASDYKRRRADGSLQVEN